MQSRKHEITGKGFRLSGDQTIYTPAFLTVTGSWIGPETYPGAGEVKVACPPLSNGQTSDLTSHSPVFP